MADFAFISHVPDELKAAVELQAEQEGIQIQEWVSRALARQLAQRHTRVPEPNLFGYYAGFHSPFLSNEQSRFASPLVGVKAAYPSNFAATYPFGFGEAKAFGIYGLAQFVSRLDHGAMLLSAALLEGAVRHFQPHHDRGRNRRPRGWLGQLVADCRERSEEVRQALLFQWEPSERAAELAIDGFRVLSELTPTSWELQRLCEADRPRAFGELARHLALATEQFALNARLVEEIESIESIETPSHHHESERLFDVQGDLLQRAGGGLSLTEASDRLGISRQGLHKRVKTGSALGLMFGSELVFPLAQWVVDASKLVPINGLKRVIQLFDTAGGWSALQFLIEQDPNLGTSPRLALIDGRESEVAAAAEAYLGLEGD